MARASKLAELSPDIVSAEVNKANLLAAGKEQASDGERKAAENFAPLVKAHADLMALEAEGTRIAPGAEGSTESPTLNALVPPKQQQYLQAGRNFSSIVGQIKSGATINKDEMSRFVSTFLGKSGDDAQTLKNKQMSREIFIGALQAGVGRSGEDAGRILGEQIKAGRIPMSVLPTLQMIYVEGKGFVPVAKGQTVQQAIAAKNAPPTQAAAPASSGTTSPTSGFGAAMDAGEGFARGVGKGAGSTAFHLGDIMRYTPSDLLFPGLSMLTGAKTVGDIGGKIGGMSSDQAFAQEPEDIQAHGTAENVGKTLEQIAEFFLPAGKVGMAQRGAADLVTEMPKAAGTVRKLATDAAWKAAPVLDNAVTAGATSLAHGEKDPQYAAGASALAGALGIGAGQLTQLLNTPAGRQIIPILVGSGAMKLLSGMGADIATSGGTGLLAGTAARNIARRVLTPQNAGRMMWAAEGAGSKAGTVAAGAVDQTRRRRREPE